MAAPDVTGGIAAALCSTNRTAPEMHVEHVYVLGLDRSLDAEARVERLVCEQQTKLARYVRRFVDDAELSLDIVQDVFFAAYRTLRDDPTRPLSAGWLYKSATNHAISYLRKKKRRGESVPLFEMGERGIRADEASATSLDLRAALATLNEDQLACVMLTTYAGYSSGEAALILGSTADAVRQRVCRAMRVLRTSLVEPS